MHTKEIRNFYFLVLNYNLYLLRFAVYATSLNHDESTWDILNQASTQSFAFRDNNKREDLTFKMVDREMVQQRGFNPFNPNSDYANDVANFGALLLIDKGLSSFLCFTFRADAICKKTRNKFFIFY